MFRWRMPTSQAFANLDKYSGILRIGASKEFCSRTAKNHQADTQSEGANPHPTYFAYSDNGRVPGGFWTVVVLGVRLGLMFQFHLRK